MALNLQGLTLRDAVGLACAKFGLVGSPVWDEAAWVDLSTVAAAWPGAGAYPGDGRTCRVPTEAEVNAAAQDVADAATAATTRAANKVKAQAFMSGVTSIRNELATFKAQATTLSGKTYSGTTAAQLAAVENDVKAIATRLAALMNVIDKVVDGEVFLGGEVIR